MRALPTLAACGWFVAAAALLAPGAPEIAGGVAQAQQLGWPDSRGGPVQQEPLDLSGKESPFRGYEGLGGTLERLTPPICSSPASDLPAGDWMSSC